MGYSTNPGSEVDVSQWPELWNLTKRKMRREIQRIRDDHKKKQFVGIASEPEDRLPNLVTKGIGLQHGIGQSSGQEGAGIVSTVGGIYNGSCPETVLEDRKSPEDTSHDEMKPKWMRCAEKSVSKTNIDLYAEFSINQSCSQSTSPLLAAQIKHSDYTLETLTSSLQSKSPRHARPRMRLPYEQLDTMIIPFEDSNPSTYEVSFDFLILLQSPLTDLRANQPPKPVLLSPHILPWVYRAPRGLYHHLHRRHATCPLQARSSPIPQCFQYRQWRLKHQAKTPLSFLFLSPCFLKPKPSKLFFLSGSHHIVLAVVSMARRSSKR